jgi:hypothetical protein
LARGLIKLINGPIANLMDLMDLIEKTGVFLFRGGAPRSILIPAEKYMLRVPADPARLNPN